MAAAALITVLWLQELGRGPQGAEFLARTIALSMLIGLVVGYVVPTAYRDSMRRAPAPVAAAGAAAGRRHQRTPSHSSFTPVRNMPPYNSR